MATRVTVSDILKQGRILLLDPSRGPTVRSQTSDPGSDRLQDVRLAGADTEIGTQGWEPGISGFPFGVLAATRIEKSYKVAQRSDSDWTAYLHIALSPHIDGQVDYNTWAYDWESALDEWFPTYYRLAELGQQHGAVGDLWWKYTGGDVGIFTMSGLAFFGFVARMHVHVTNLVSFNV
jgi:hypothetical protein